jgi:hypothetical protein
MNVLERIVTHRRDLFKLISSLGISGVFDSGFAAQCDKTSTEFVVTDHQIYYWLDGFQRLSAYTHKEGPKTFSTCRLALSIDLPHNINSYVESVHVYKNSTELVAVQCFTDKVPNSMGKTPFCVFEGLMVEERVDILDIYFSVRELGTKLSYFRYRISSDNVRESRLDFSHLTPGAVGRVMNPFVDDIKAASHQFAFPSDSNLAPPGFGYFTTVFHRFVDIDPHFVKSKIRSLSPNGDFSIEIAAMHDDVSEDHYMRYFLVLDPVGRILGGLKRRMAGPGRSAYNTINRRLDIQTNDSALFDKERQNLLTRNIIDCPYIMVITEDRQDALARNSIRIR